ncbi:MAG: TetR/AcrR family transcriptional regulator [Terracidiphilus sp.]|jgi:AcrR family transcriptional regulator
MPPKSAEHAATDRPRRGTPDQTRERLIQAAAKQFNRLGYHGTDSNTIAKAAGYATGTFYKHFSDKREIFLAAYERWLAAQWQEVSAELALLRNPEKTARKLVALSIRFHSEWSGLRASLMELVFSDPEARKFFRKQRRMQLERIIELRSRFALPAQTGEQDAILLWTTERVYDAIGQGEVQSLGLDKEQVIESMVERVRTFLK